MADSKICSECDKEKDITEFKKGRGRQCKLCLKEKSKIYYQENKAKINEKHKLYHQENKTQINEKQRQYHQENRTQINEKGKRYYQENKKSFSEIKNKICPKCNIEKDIVNFGSRSELCNSCRKDKRKEYSKQYQLNNKEKNKVRHKKYYQENKKPLEIKKYKTCSQCNIEKDIVNFGTCSKLCNHCRKDKKKETKRLYYKNNSKKVLEWNKKSDQKNKKKRYESRNNRIKNNPALKLRLGISAAIRQALKKQSSGKKGHSILNFLPYNFDELKNHLELLFSHPDNLSAGGQVWMTWNNWGVYNRAAWNDSDSLTWTWQIDHIIPQLDLPFTSLEDENFKKCWALDNLRPLRADINSIEGASRTRHKGKV